VAGGWRGNLSRGGGRLAGGLALEPA